MEHSQQINQEELEAKVLKAIEEIVAEKGRGAL
jgi:hypothetical protein